MVYALSIPETIFLLFALHALVDYGLSTEYVAFAKSHKRPEGKGVWPWVLGAHCLMHGGAVFFVTGNLYLGISEFVAHAATDYLKSSGRISYGTDQAIHYLTKVLWVAIVVLS